MALEWANQNVATVKATITDSSDSVSVPGINATSKGTPDNVATALNSLLGIVESSIVANSMIRSLKQGVVDNG